MAGRPNAVGRGVDDRDMPVSIGNQLLSLQVQEPSDFAADRATANDGYRGTPTQGTLRGRRRPLVNRVRGRRLIASLTGADVVRLSSLRRIGRPKMKSVTRLREPAIALLILQALLPMLGFPEFMYDHPASVVGIAASTLMAVGWIALAAWSGTRGWRSFLILALAFWGLAIIVCLVAMWAAGSDAIVPRYQALLLLIIVLGPALHGLSPFVPIESQQVRYLVTVLGMLTLTMAGYLMGRVVARRPTSQDLRRRRPTLGS